MNLPNKLTTARVIMIPFFLVFLMTNFFEGSNYVALAIFIIASLTDMLDGKIARKYNLVTNFGKFMDPLADKLLVCSAMIAFIELGLMPAWIVIIIIAREFIISGFRLIAAERNVVIAAGMSGKIKTTVQMIMCCLLIARLPFGFMRYVELVFIYAALILTVYSLIVYLVQNKDILKDN
jgi:CDP-diacylglycerol---glycerol-3-phosphate 3-phosphatidyltransferase